MSFDDDTPSENRFTDLIGLKGLDAARQLYDKPHIKNQLSTYNIHKTRAFLPTLLSSYTNQLGKTNPAIFKFLNDSQREALKNRLKHTWYLLYAQHQLDDAEGRHHVLAPLVEQMIQCNKLLGELALTETTVTPKGQLDAALNDSEKYLKYIGATIVAPLVVEQTMDLIDGKPPRHTVGITKFVKDGMSYGNGLRLFHWVWGVGMVSASIDKLPDDFYNKGQAQDIVSAPATTMGYISWILYYARGLINLGLLLKHTINGPWMNAEEAKIPAGERFTTHLQQKKFALLNDFIWATANMAGFFWLIGALSFAGNLATAGLLLMDLSLTAWRFCEESTEHNKNMLVFKKAQEQLQEELNDTNEQLQTLQAELAKTQKRLKRLPKDDLEYPVLVSAVEEWEKTLPTLLQNKSELEQKITENKKIIRDTAFDWKYKRYGTINDLAYAASLLVAFSLMCCFFCPPALIVHETLMSIALAGAAICFLLTLTTASVSTGLEIAKAEETGADLQSNREELLQQFETATDENTRKMLYLEMAALMADTDYQQRVATFQKIKLTGSILIGLLTPVLIFASSVFLPLTIGLSFMASGFALAIFSKILVDFFEPQAAALPCFDEEEYEAFRNSQIGSFHSERNASSNLGFFPSKTGKSSTRSLISENDDLSFSLSVANG